MFRFKKFGIEDANCAHKVGTDGTLLGAWASVENANHVLDIGTGSGLIALMVAQRTAESTTIDAIELSHAAYEQATENAIQSPWSHKVKIHHTSLQEFHAEQNFDCILSNPPYFSNSFKPPNESRIAPRHTDTLSFEELIAHSKRLLTNDGKLNVILPYAEGVQFIELAKQHALYLTRQWGFRTRKEKPIERWLLEFSQLPEAIETNEILLYAKAEEWSDQYKDLTRDFYLKL
jgi:tRNA1Val (adenine37-N6)-methyltransferase